MPAVSAKLPTLFLSNIAWDFVWQRHQTLASLFAEYGDVVFCEVPGIRRIGVRDARRLLARWRELRATTHANPVPAGVRIVRPFVLPATNPVFRALNARLVARFLARESALAAGVDWIVNYSPSRTALQLLGAVPHRRLVYDCTDDWLAVRGIPAVLAGDEREILRRADLTVVPSRRLEETKRPLARRLVRLPHGVLLERFLMEPRRRRPAEPLAVLYYGHVHAQHLDLAAIDALSESRPGWRVTLVGPVKTPHRFRRNVVLWGQQPHDRLRNFIQEADVLLLPYVTNEYTRAVLPAKTYECLATGLPVVAAPLPELTADFAGHIRFAAQPTEWVSVVEQAVRQNTEEARKARIEVAKANTWSARFAALKQLLAEVESGAPV